MTQTTVSGSAGVSGPRVFILSKFPGNVGVTGVQKKEWLQKIYHTGAGEVVQWVKAFATKLDDPSKIPDIHMAGEPSPSQLFPDHHMHTVACTPPPNK